MLTQYAFSILFIDKKKAKFSNDRFWLKVSVAAMVVYTHQKYAEKFLQSDLY